MSKSILTEAEVKRFKSCTLPLENGCILWTGPVHKGWAIFRIYQSRKATFGAQRLSYELTRGEISQEFTVVLKCQTKFCVNPDHAELRSRHQIDSVEERFKSKTRPTENGCILWTGSTGTGGYGKFHVVNDGVDSTIRAHRMAYELSFGEIPEGLLVLHKCDNPPCVNPEHLFLGTDKDNSQDMIRKGRAKPVKGEASGMSKLTEEDVRSIRKKYIRGKYGCQRIARELKVSTPTIQAVINKLTWKHID